MRAASFSSRPATFRSEGARFDIPRTFGAPGSRSIAATNPSPRTGLAIDVGLCSVPPGDAEDPGTSSIRSRRLRREPMIPRPGRGAKAQGTEAPESSGLPGSSSRDTGPGVLNGESLTARSLLSASSSSSSSPDPRSGRAPSPATSAARAVAISAPVALDEPEPWSHRALGIALFAVIGVAIMLALLTPAGIR